MRQFVGKIVLLLSKEEKNIGDGKVVVLLLFLVLVLVLVLVVLLPSFFLSFFLLQCFVGGAVALSRCINYNNKENVKVLNHIVSKAIEVFLTLVLVLVVVLVLVLIIIIAVSQYTTRLVVVCIGKRTYTTTTFWIIV